jgi:hypothetical protein
VTDDDERGVLEYYSTDGVLSDPGNASAVLEPLPTSVEGLVDVVQGLMVHVYWADRYGVALSEERRKEPQLRTVPRLLARVMELDDRPLVEVRPIEHRIADTCRDFTVLLCTLLRHQGLPARARCGFGTYFLPDHFEDHWVAEVWQADRNRWILVDAQLDRLQRDTLGIAFDPLDVPTDAFVGAGRAWPSPATQPGRSSGRCTPKSQDCTPRRSGCRQRDTGRLLRYDLPVTTEKNTDRVPRRDRRRPSPFPEAEVRRLRHPYPTTCCSRSKGK